MSQKLSNRTLVGTLIIIIIILGTAIGISILNQAPEIEEIIGFTDLQKEKISYDGNFTANVSIISSEFYKGDNVKFTLNFEVNYSPVLLEFIKFELSDLINNRTARQIVIINSTYQVGSYSLNLSLSPGFDDDGFIALTNQDYVVNNFLLKYVQRRISLEYFKDLDFSIRGRLKPEFNQFDNINWTISTENATVIQNNRLIRLNSTENQANITIKSGIQTTGYSRIYFNITGINTSSVFFDINGSILNSDNDYLPIGNWNGMQNFTISVSLKNFENISIAMSLPTKHIPILAIIASNNWEGLSSDGFYYRDTEYYLSQVSDRFERGMNISIIPVSQVEFESNSGTDLYELADEAKYAVGDKFNFTGNTWTVGTGTQPENAGADILIILTGKTMDHLGIVLGASGEAFNMAIHARGSEFEGSYRLPSIYADNLIQHELSHVFGAPDRWTEDYPDLVLPSIMAKSRPDDVFLDIILRYYWLMRTNWVEEDIQTIVERAPLYL